MPKSDRTLEVGGYIYFPRDTVRMDLLKITPKTPSDPNVRTACSSTTSSRAISTMRRAAWSYLAPQPKMKPVDHWIGFWEDVAIQ